MSVPMPEELRAALRVADPDLFIVVSLSVTPSATAYTAVSGSRRVNGWPPSIQKMTPIRTKFDQRSQDAPTGQVEIVYSDDGWLRYAISRYTLRGGRATIRLGAFKPDGTAISEASMDPIGEGEIAKVVPEGGVIRVCVDLNARGAVKDQTIHRTFEGTPPLDVIAELLGEVAAPTAYSAVSFDSSRYPAISHWSVSRTGRPPGAATPWQERDQGQQDKVIELIRGISHLLPGMVVPDRTGRLAFKEDDPRAPVVRHLTRNDVIEVHQYDVNTNVINRSALALEGERYIGDVLKKQGFSGVVGVRRDETNSQNFLRYPGTTNPRIFGEAETNPWLNGATFLEATTNLGVGGPWTIRVRGEAAKYGFAGCYLPPDQRVPGGVTPVNNRLNPGLGRYGYIYVALQQTRIFNTLRVTSATHVWTNVSIDEYGYHWPGWIDLVCDQQGVFGSNGSGAAQFGASVFDVTIPAAWTQRRIEKYFLGVPTCRLRAHLWHRDLENADLISFDDPAVCGAGFTQADENTVWRIIGVEEAPIGDGKGLWLDLEWVRTNIVLIPKPTTAVIDVGDRRDGGDDDAGRTDMQPRVVDEANHFLLVSTSGLTATIGRGATRGPSPWTRYTDELIVTLQATRDNYVYANSLNRGLTVADVAVAAPAPTTPLGGVLVWMFRTDGSGVTISTDARNDSAKVISGLKLIDNTVGREQFVSPVSQDHFNLSVDPTDRQREDRRVFRVTTTNAASTTVGQVQVAEGESALVSVRIVARRTSGGSTRAAFWVSALVYRDSGGNVTIGAGGLTVHKSDADGSGYTGTIDVDTASQTVRARVVGAVGHTVEWLAVFDLDFSFA